ncbi:MAG: transposase [Lachnospiraceae bacterium]|nr:transposase [Lachnospiraceae bacterium]
MNNKQKKDVLEPKDKYLLTINEAADYFGIGMNRLRELSRDRSCDFFVTVGRYKSMVIRHKLEKYIENHRFL